MLRSTIGCLPFNGNFGSKDVLKTAAERLTKSLRAFTQADFPQNQDQLFPHYSDDSIPLASSNPPGINADHIILIPDTLFHFDVTDPKLIEKLQSYFHLPPEFDKVGVPSFSAFLNALLMCLGESEESKAQAFPGFQKGRWRMDDLESRIACYAAAMFVSWRIREPLAEDLGSPDDYPYTVKEIRNCLPTESHTNVRQAIHNVFNRV
ncbi:hypothetical protein TWF718_008219 [Orbilia javanica]|uniref:Uncharacterized protein n=1 Tax=Orbilia javanica TaxID=47235 RepID=A0AAN8RH55_9PEZI